MASTWPSLLGRSHPHPEEPGPDVPRAGHVLPGLSLGSGQRGPEGLSWRLQKAPASLWGALQPVCPARLTQGPRFSCLFAEPRGASEGEGGRAVHLGLRCAQALVQVLVLCRLLD